MATLHVFSNRHIKSEVKNIKQGDSIYLENSISRKRWSRYFAYNNIDECNLGVTFITQEEYFSLEGTTSKMKFDFAVLNPPYTDGDTLLYPQFFEQALKIADTVNIVMPFNLESTQVRLRKHNNLVKKHATFISEDISHEFNVNTGAIVCVEATLKQVNAVKKIDKLASYSPILPKNSRLMPRRGINVHWGKVPPSKDSKDMLHTVYRGDKPSFVKVSSSFSRSNSMKTQSPWLVFTNENPSNGLFNVYIEKNEGQIWGSGVFAFDAASKADAVKLKNWLTSPLLQEEVKKLLKLNNSYSCSGVMIKKLPNIK
jgi:hypothetical protein